MELLDKAKAAIVLDHPFYATLLLSMPMIETKGIPTMATNGEDIFYNPDFVKTQTVQELVFVLAHELDHCIFMHCIRKGNRDHSKFNQATDYVINDLLVTDKVGTMPKGGLYNPELVKQGEGIAERVYDLLADDDGKGEGNGNPGGSLDDLIHQEGMDEATASQKEAEMKVKVIQAANIAKACGKLSAGVERLVKQLAESKVDWKTVLRNFVTTRAKIDWSFAKPKRRFLAEDIYLPGLTGEKLGDIVVAIDCSGSIDEKALSEFGGETKAIKEDTLPSNVHVVYFDSKVLRKDTFTTDDEFEVKAVGGGGTAFSPVFKYLEENDIVPECCVFLTDLYCDDFGEQPSYPVLWVTTGETKAPFGEVVKMK